MEMKEIKTILESIEEALLIKLHKELITIRKKQETMGEGHNKNRIEVIGHYNLLDALINKLIASHKTLSESQTNIINFLKEKETLENTIDELIFEGQFSEPNEKDKKDKQNKEEPTNATIEQMNKENKLLKEKLSHCTCEKKQLKVGDMVNWCGENYEILRFDGENCIAVNNTGKSFTLMGIGNFTNEIKNKEFKEFHLTDLAKKITETAKQNN